MLHQFFYKNNVDQLRRKYLNFDDNELSLIRELSTNRTVLFFCKSVTLSTDGFLVVAICAATLWTVCYVNCLKFPTLLKYTLQ